MHVLNHHPEDLIETLWNVKNARFSSHIFAPIGFNRDIVECKAGSRMAVARRGDSI